MKSKPATARCDEGALGDRRFSAISDQRRADLRLLQEGGQGQRCSRKAQNHVHPVTTGVKQAAQVQQFRVESVLRDAAELQDAEDFTGRCRLGYIGERQKD